MTRIVIVDDHAIVRRGLIQILADNPELMVVAECSSGRELVGLIDEKQCDLVLLDISIPGRNGIDVCKQVKSLYPRLPVLILSMHPEEQYAVRALKSGASGYITKESAPDELVTAIAKVSGGGMYVSASLAEKLALTLGKAGKMQAHELLSDREYQVMCQIASGKTADSIAHELSLSVKTIRTYRSRLLMKTRMKNNAELTSYAIRNGLVI